MRDLFVNLGKSLGATFRERDEVIDGLLCAALAQEHVLLLGPPGTAKSALARAFAESVGGNHFEWLLSKFTAPEELFGPISLQGLKADRYRRVTTGKLPEAETVFLDEIFKGGSAILNTLLAAINERVFHNDGQVQKLPLRMVIGASNELPEGPELGALYDRFLLRYWVGYLQGPTQFIEMMRSSEQLFSRVISTEQWDTARAEVAKLPVDPDLYQSLFKLRTEAQKVGLALSDRRWMRMIRLVKASAWLAGDKVADLEHFDVLKAALWSDPGERDAANKLVEDTVGGVLTLAASVSQTIERQVQNAQLDLAIPARDAEWQRKLITAQQETSRGVARLKELQTQAATKSQKAKLAALVEKAEQTVAPVKATLKASLEI